MSESLIERIQQALEALKAIRADLEYTVANQAQVEKTRREKLNEYIKSRNTINRSKTPNPQNKGYANAKKIKVSQTEHTDEKKPS
jgi:hypothetical protein